VKRAGQVRGPTARPSAVLLTLGLLACKPGVSASASPGRDVSRAIADKATVKTPFHGPSPDASRARAKIFPDAAPPYLAGEPIRRGPSYARRVYISGERRVEITIAPMAREPGAFERWVEGSASYPQAPLALPSAQANGFFTCVSDRADSPCDLHIQLRSGFHVEAMGNGRVPRADLIDLLAHIPLGDLSDSTFADL
jgi:hypothetical protein